MPFPILTLDGSDCSVPVTQFFALRAVTILVAMVSEKDIWQHFFFKQVINLVPNAVQKANCSSTRFFLKYNH